MGVWVCTKGRFNYRIITLSEVEVAKGKREGVIIHNKTLDRLEIHFETDEAYHKAIKLRG